MAGSRPSYYKESTISLPSQNSELVYFLRLWLKNEAASRPSRGRSSGRVAPNGQNIGQQVTFRDMLRLLCSYIYYDVVPEPLPQSSMQPLRGTGDWDLSTRQSSLKTGTSCRRCFSFDTEESLSCQRLILTSLTRRHHQVPRQTFR